jgi:hypothetical protein
MKIWCDLMTRHVVGRIVKYDDAFFNWLGLKILMIDDYAYTGLDFQGDPDLVLPKGSQWGDLGKKYFCFLQCFYEF